ncbi:hypothetical protein BDZ88DRAFT_481612 [Geranomyces variabilis]|nr:hypothetical protein BDZ88DRAFT_481612 [Geranomyces variabilis]
MRRLQDEFNLTYNPQQLDSSASPPDSAALDTAATLLLAPHHLPTLLFHHAFAIALTTALHQQVLLISPRTDTATGSNNTNNSRSTATPLPYYISPHGHPLIPALLARIHIRRIPASLDALRALLAWLPHVDPPVGVPRAAAGHAVAGIVVEDFGRWFEAAVPPPRHAESAAAAAMRAEDGESGGVTADAGVHTTMLWDLGAQMIAALVELARWYASQAGNGSCSLTIGLSTGGPHAATLQRVCERYLPRIITVTGQHPHYRLVASTSTTCIAMSFASTASNDGLQPQSCAFTMDDDGRRVLP